MLVYIFLLLSVDTTLYIDYDFIHVCSTRIKEEKKVGPSENVSRGGLGAPPLTAISPLLPYLIAPRTKGTINVTRVLRLVRVIITNTRTCDIFARYHRPFGFTLGEITMCFLCASTQLLSVLNYIVHPAMMVTFCSRRARPV